MRKKPGNLKKPRLEYVYYANHDKRYAHLSREERDEYPDAIILHDPEEGPVKFRRRYTASELDKMCERSGWQEFWEAVGHRNFELIGKHGIEITIFDKDTPMNKVIKDTHERRRRFAKPITIPS